MRKSWKWALCLGAVSLLLLGGCGKEKTEPVDLVLVTDGSEVASDAVYQSAWNGLAQYGDESGLKYEASVPSTLLCGWRRSENGDCTATRHRCRRHEVNVEDNPDGKNEGDHVPEEAYDRDAENHRLDARIIHHHLM